MENSEKTIVPFGLKIFALIYVLKNTVPTLLFSVLKLLHFEVPNSVSFVFYTLSKNVKAMLVKDNYPFLMSIVISLVVLFVFYKFWNNNLRLEKTKKKVWLTILKILVILSILSTIIFALKQLNDITGYESEAWGLMINPILTGLLNIAFMIYLFTNKKLKDFFQSKKES